MPVITTGEGGNNGVAEFVAALRAGRGDAMDRRRAEEMEKLYEQRLQLGTQQVMMNEAKLDALGDEERARQTYGELEGIWAQAQASGDPANVAGFQVMFNTQPEAVKLWGRLAADSPELANVFRDNILKDAQANMEREQMAEFLETAQAAEGVYLPEGWTAQAEQDIKSGGITQVEKERERVRERDKYATRMTADQENQEQLARFDVLMGDKPSTHVRDLRNRLDVEAQVRPGVRLDKDMVAEFLMAVTSPDGAPPQVGDVPTGDGSIQGPGGETYDPLRNLMNQAPDQASSGAAAVDRAKLLDAAREDLPDMFRAKDSDALKEWGEEHGLTPAGVLELFEIIDAKQMQRKAADEAQQNETLKGAPGRATATGVRR